MGLGHGVVVTRVNRDDVVDVDRDLIVVGCQCGLNEGHFTSPMINHAAPDNDLLGDLFLFRDLFTYLTYPMRTASVFIYRWCVPWRTTTVKA